MPEEEARPWRRLAGNFWAPVPWMLEAAIVLQLVLGEYVESAVIGVLVLFNAVLGFVQEGRAEATLRALKSRLALNASVRRGEAVAEVSATGLRTRFGRTAELVRTAHGTSAQQVAVLQIVRNLAIFNGAIVLAQLAYAAALRLPTHEVIPLTLTAILAAIPVALPATFTLASALGARALAARAVLPTRLSAVEEAATLDVLCSDKTGTLTQNALAVSAVRPMPGYDAPRLLRLAALASAEGGQDPVDVAIRAAAAQSSGAHTAARDTAISESTAAPADTAQTGAGDRGAGCTQAGPLSLVRFVPFDPANKTAEATARDTSGRTLRIVKGAFDTLRASASTPEEARCAVAELAAKGYRVLAVAVGEVADASAPHTSRMAPQRLELVGLIALSDPPRTDSAALIGELRSMGVRTVMVTGDAPATAAVVARAVGLDGPVCPPGPPPTSVHPEDFAVFAGVFPEDKFHIVKAFQQGGHTVGMCGDGANDAPALRQAQMGIAVSTATDVAKSAAGIVLTEPGLGGIVTAIREGRITFQRILTYTLRSLTQKLTQMLLLVTGLAMNVAFSTAVVALGYFWLGLARPELRTLAAVTLVFVGQATFYVVRDRRRLWSSRPSGWIVASSAADVLIISLLATQGFLMSAISLTLVAAVFAASVVLVFVLDTLKYAVSSRLKMQ